MSNELSCNLVGIRRGPCYMYMSHELIYYICTWVTNSFVICPWCPCRNSKGPLLYVHESRTNILYMHMSHELSCNLPMISFSEFEGAPAIYVHESRTSMQVTNYGYESQVCCNLPIISFSEFERDPCVYVLELRTDMRVTNYVYVSQDCFNLPMISFSEFESAHAYIYTWLTILYTSHELCIRVARLLQFADDILVGIRRGPHVYMYIWVTNWHNICLSKRRGTRITHEPRTKKIPALATGLFSVNVAASPVGWPLMKSSARFLYCVRYWKIQNPQETLHCV